MGTQTDLLYLREEKQPPCSSNCPPPMPPRKIPNSLPPMPPPLDPDPDHDRRIPPPTTTEEHHHHHSHFHFLPWFSPSTGIYSSTHAPVDLPSHDLPSHVLSSSLHARAHAHALVDASTGSSLSYRDLRQGVRRIASGLRRLGVSRGTVVLIALPNSVVLPVVFLAVLSSGAVAAPVNPLGSPDELSRRSSASRAAFAFASSPKKLEGTGVTILLTPSSFAFDDSQFPLFHELLSSEEDNDPELAPSAGQDDVAALLQSSGTSGLSKGVALTHRNLISMVELFVRFEASQYAWDPAKNVYLCALPMFHVYGLSMFAAGLLALGSAVVVMRRFEVGEAVEAIERYGVTHFPVVPPIMAALCKAKEVMGCGLLSLKQVSCGAAPLAEEHVREFLRSFPHVDLIQGYGMTETTAVGTRGFNGNHRKYTSVGLLAPNMEAKVIDVHNRSCLPPGHKGELWLRGPAIMKGYLNNEAATSLTIVGNGWLKTGDIAYFDQDGFLFITDRLKEIIKYKGYQIAPADLEAVLISHPEIIDASVTGALDDDAGEIPVAFVVKKSKSTLSSAEVITYVAEKVAPYKKVRKVVFVNSIPRSPSGKILRRLLREYPISKL